jgi:hypothetical protein
MTKPPKNGYNMGYKSIESGIASKIRKDWGLTSSLGRKKR